MFTFDVLFHFKFNAAGEIVALKLNYFFSNLIVCQTVQQIARANTVIKKIKMEEERVSKPYLIQNQTKQMINQEELSDVSFLVGPERTKIYAHKCLMAAGSDVFKAMLFGELKETSNEIVIPDVSHSVFLNMVRYAHWTSSSN